MPAIIIAIAITITIIVIVITKINWIRFSVKIPDYKFVALNVSVYLSRDC